MLIFMFVNCFQSLNGFGTYKSHKSLPLDLWIDTKGKIIKITELNTNIKFVHLFTNIQLMIVLVRNVSYCKQLKKKRI